MVGRTIRLAAVAALAVTARAANVTAAGVDAEARSCSDLDARPAIEPTRVRARDAFARYLLAKGNENSATFARLVAVLERSDIVVYVDAEPRAGIGPSGRLRFVASGGGLRYLHVRVEPGSTSWPLAVQRRFDLIAILGHELQHAAEVASAPVSDAAGLARLYRSIGTPLGSHSFDTETARDVGHRVLVELFGGGAGQPPECDEAPADVR